MAVNISGMMSDYYESGGKFDAKQEMSSFWNKVDGIKSPSETAMDLTQVPEGEYQEQINRAIDTAAQKYNLEPELIRSVIYQESRFNPNATSRDKDGNPIAHGIMQMTPGTARDMGVTKIYDIDQNIDGGSKYLRAMLDRYNGDLTKALQGYNAGPSKTDKVYSGAIDTVSGKPHVFRQETRDYVPSVLSRLSSDKPMPITFKETPTDQKVDHSDAPAISPAKGKPNPKDEIMAPQFENEDNRTWWEMLTNPEVPAHVLDQIADEAAQFDEFGGEHTDETSDKIIGYAKGAYTVYEMAELGIERGEIGQKMMYGRATAEDEARLKDISNQLVLMDEEVKAQPYVAQAVGQLAPFIVRQAIERGKGWLIGGMIGGVTGAVAGNLIPGAAFLPEEALTAPGGMWLGGKIGALFSGFEDMSGIEAGGLYLDLKEAGIQDDIARKYSELYGGASGAAEIIGFNYLTKLVPGGGKLGKKLFLEGLTKALKQRAAMQVAKSYVGATVAEGGTESLQKLLENAAQIAAVRAQDELDGTNLAPETIEEYKEVLMNGVVESGKLALVGTAVIGAPMAGISMVVESDGGGALDMRKNKAKDQIAKPKKEKQTKIDEAIQKVNDKYNVEKAAKKKQLEEEEKAKKQAAKEAGNEPFNFTEDKNVAKDEGDKTDRQAELARQNQGAINEIAETAESAPMGPDVAKVWGNFFGDQTKVETPTNVSEVEISPVVVREQKRLDAAKTLTADITVQKVEDGVMTVQINDPDLAANKQQPIIEVPVGPAVRKIKQFIKKRTEELKPATVVERDTETAYQAQVLEEDGVDTAGMNKADVQQRYAAEKYDVPEVEQVAMASKRLDLPENQDDAKEVLGNTKQTEINKPALMLSDGTTYVPTNPDGSQMVLETRPFSKRRTKEYTLAANKAYDTAKKQAKAEGLDIRGAMFGQMFPNGKWYSNGFIKVNSGLLGKVIEARIKNEKTLAKRQFSPQHHKEVSGAIRDGVIEEQQAKAGVNKKIEKLYRKIVPESIMPYWVASARKSGNKLFNNYGKRYTDNKGNIYPDQLESVGHTIAFKFISGYTRQVLGKEKEALTEAELRKKTEYAVINGLRNFVKEEERQASGKKVWEIQEEITEGTFQSVQGTGFMVDQDVNEAADEMFEGGDETVLSAPYANHQTLLDVGYYDAVAKLRRALKLERKKNKTMRDETRGELGTRTPDSKIITMAQKWLDEDTLNQVLASIDIDQMPSPVVSINPEEYMRDKAVEKQMEASKEIEEYREMTALWKNRRVKPMEKLDMLRKALNIFPDQVSDADTTVRSFTQQYLDEARAMTEVSAESVAKAEIYEKKRKHTTNIFSPRTGKPFKTRDWAQDLVDDLNDNPGEKQEGVLDLYYQVVPVGDEFVIQKVEVYKDESKAEPTRYAKGAITTEINRMAPQAVDQRVEEEAGTKGFMQEQIEKLIGVEPKETQPHNAPMHIYVKNEEGGYDDVQVVPTQAANIAGKANSQEATRLYWSRYAALLEFLTSKTQEQLNAFMRSLPKGIDYAVQWIMDPSFVDFAFRHRRTTVYDKLRAKGEKAEPTQNRIQHIDKLKKMKIDLNRVAVTSSGAVASHGIIDSNTNKDLDLIIDPEYAEELNKRDDIEEIVSDGVSHYRTKDGVIEFWMPHDWGNMKSDWKSVKNRATRAGSILIEDINDVAERYTSINRGEKARQIADAVLGVEDKAVTIEALADNMKAAMDIDVSFKRLGVMKKVKDKETQIVGDEMGRPLVMETKGLLEEDINSRIHKFMTLSIDKLADKIARWHKETTPLAQEFIDEVFQKEDAALKKYHDIMQKEHFDIKLNAAEEAFYNKYKKKLEINAARSYMQRTKEWLVNRGLITAEQAGAIKNVQTLDALIRKLAKKPAQRKALRTAQERQDAINKIFSDEEAAPVLDPKTKELLLRLAKQAEVIQNQAIQEGRMETRYGKVDVESMPEGWHLFRFKNADGSISEQAGPSPSYIYVNSTIKRQRQVNKGDFRHYIKGPKTLRKMKPLSSTDLVQPDFYYKEDVHQFIPPKEEAKKAKKGTKKAKTPKKLTHKMIEDLREGNTEAAERFGQAHPQLAKQLREAHNAAVADIAKRLKEAKGDLETLDALSVEGQKNQFLREAAEEAEKAAAKKKKGDFEYADTAPKKVEQAKQKVKKETKEAVLPPKADIPTVDVTDVRSVEKQMKKKDVTPQPVSGDTVTIEGRTFPTNEEMDYYNDILEDMDSPLSAAQEEWLIEKVNSMEEERLADDDALMESLQQDAENSGFFDNLGTGKSWNYFLGDKGEGGYIVLDPENSPILKLIRAMKKKWDNMRKAAKINPRTNMYGRFKGWFDVESNFRKKTIQDYDTSKMSPEEIKTLQNRLNQRDIGFHIKNLFSFQESQMDKFEKNVLKPFIRLVNKTNPGGVTKKYLASLIFAAEDTRYEGKIRTELGPEFWDQYMNEPVQFLRKFFRDAREEYAERGVRVDYVARSIAYWEDKWLNSDNYAEATKAASKLAKLQGTEFIHLPTSFWTSEVLAKAEPKKGDTEKQMRKKAQLRESIKKRHAITMADLVRRGMLEVDQVNPFEILLHYGYQKSRDMSMYNVRDALIASGMIRTRTSRPKESKEFGDWVKISGMKEYKRLNAIMTTDKKYISKIPEKYRQPTATYISRMALDALEAVMASDAPRNVWQKGMNMYKMLRFFNPIFLPAYDLWQSAGLAGAIGLTTPRSIVGAVKHAWNNSPEYRAALDNGLASKPFSPWWGDYLTQARRMAEQKGLLGDTIGGKLKRIPVVAQYYYLGEVRRIIDTISKGTWGQRLGLPLTVPFKTMILPIMQASWDLSWMMDRGIRLYTYTYLRGQGLSEREAAQTAAIAHGDYAGVPSRTRRKLNSFFFTPTFKIAMFKAHKRLLQDTVAYPLSLATNKKNPINIRRHQALRAALALGLLTYSLDLTFKSLGFEEDELGRKYVKTIMTDQGPKELVINWSTPLNLVQKYYKKISVVVNSLMGKEVQTDDPWGKMLQQFTFDLHPVYQSVYNVYRGQDLDGRQIYYKTTDSAPTIATKSARYILYQTVPLVDEMVQVAVGKSHPNKRIIREQLRKDFRNKWHVNKTFAKILEATSRAFTFKYLRSVPEKRLQYRIDNLNSEVAREMTQRYWNEDGGWEKAIEVYIKKLNEAVRMYEREKK